jgi:predicted ABC-type sugar transport system permease subunit
MRTRKALQILILAAALIVGVSQPVFNGLSLLALLSLPAVFLLQPGVLLRLRGPKLRLVK